ncbi:hypothetical protein U1Q18_003599, partial [Sarracenia purpurea var. burkii]
NMQRSFESISGGGDNEVVCVCVVLDDDIDLVLDLVEVDDDDFVAGNNKMGSRTATRLGKWKW